LYRFRIQQRQIAKKLLFIKHSHFGAVKSSRRGSINSKPPLKKRLAPDPFSPRQPYLNRAIAIPTQDFKSSTVATMEGARSMPGRAMEARQKRENGVTGINKTS
jgi:hypothetical protein